MAIEGRDKPKRDASQIAPWLTRLLAECEQTERRQGQMQSWAPGDKPVPVDQGPASAVGQKLAELMARQG